MNVMFGLFSGCVAQFSLPNPRHLVGTIANIEVNISGTGPKGANLSVT